MGNKMWSSFVFVMILAATSVSSSFSLSIQKLKLEEILLGTEHTSPSAESPLENLITKEIEHKAKNNFPGAEEVQFETSYDSKDSEETNKIFLGEQNQNKEPIVNDIKNLRQPNKTIAVYAGLALCILISGFILLSDIYKCTTHKKHQLIVSNSEHQGDEDPTSTSMKSDAENGATQASFSSNNDGKITADDNRVIAQVVDTDATITKGPDAPKLIKITVIHDNENEKSVILPPRTLSFL